MPETYEFRKRPHRPWPESVLPGTWIVAESGGSGATGFDPTTGKSRMHVPMSDESEEQQTTRIHEMLHVRFTRWTDFQCDRSARPSTIEKWFRNSFEDLRIEKLGSMVHPSLDLPSRTVSAKLHELNLSILEKNAATDGIPSWFVAGQATLFEVLPNKRAAHAIAVTSLDKDKYEGTKVMDILSGLAKMVLLRPHWESVVEATERAVALFRKEDERKARAEEAARTGMPEEDLGGPSTEEREAEERMDELEGLSADEGKPALDFEDADGDGKPKPPTHEKEMHAHSAPVKVVHHDLVHAHGKGFIADKVKRPSQMGAVPKYMHRWCIDMAVFESRKKAHGRAVILVDTSGSMHIQRDQLEAIMRAAPGSTIATYHARGEPECNERAQKGFGCLHIVADGGKRISEKVPRGEANACDIEALKWMTRERAMHRIWISDGGVTGITTGPGKPISGEHFTKNLVRDANDLVKAHGLKHVLSIEDGLSLLGKLYKRVQSKGPVKKTWKTEAGKTREEDDEEDDD